MKQSPWNILANIRHIIMLILLIGVQGAFAQSKACQDEKNKADAMKEKCMEINKTQGADEFKKCLEGLKAQVAKANKTCEAANQEPAVTPVKTPAAAPAKPPAASSPEQAPALAPAKTQPVPAKLQATGNVGGTAKLLESIADGNGSVTKFEYDDQNRIIKIVTNDSDTLAFAYNGNNLVSIVKFLNRGDGEEESSFFRRTEYDIKGNKIAIDLSGGGLGFDFAVNKNGYIDNWIQYESENKYKTTFQYKLGNIIKNGSETYTYDDKKSPFSNCTTPKWFLQYFFHSGGLPPVGLSNNIVTISWKGGKSSYIYEYDSDGFPIKQKGNDGNTKIFTYRGSPATTIVPVAAAVQPTPAASSGNENEPKQAKEAIKAQVAGIISEACMEEFASLPEKKEDFDLLNLFKNLAPEVIKQKAKAKLPFGKPKDTEKTSIGVTVGCLKAFPESTDKLQTAFLEIVPNVVESMVRDWGVNKAKVMLEGKLQASKEEMQSLNSIEQLKSFALEKGAESRIIEAFDAVNNGLALMKEELGKGRNADALSLVDKLGSMTDALKILKGTQLSTNADFDNKSIPNNIHVDPASKSGGISAKTIISIGLAAGGLGAIAYGVMQDKEVAHFVDERNGPDALEAEKKRNIGYGTGAALLAGGLTIYIFF